MCRRRPVPVSPPAPPSAPACVLMSSPSKDTSSLGQGSPVTSFSLLTSKGPSPEQHIEVLGARASTEDWGVQSSGHHPRKTPHNLSDNGENHESAGAETRQHP